MAEETKTATIKLYRDNVPRITITYTDKKDLFKQFQKKIKELHLPIGEIYWADWDNDRSRVKTADDLFGAVENNCNVRMYYRTVGESDIVTYPSSDEDEEKDEGEEQKVVSEKSESRSRSRSSSPDRRRPRSRSASALPYVHPSHDQMPWNFAPWQFMMDPRFASISFPHYSHLSAGSHSRRRDGGHQCSCERLSEQFDDL
ncbi:hypothetical protein Y032_0030g2223 [Ancylostoma ceylanicum]|uniref:Uncharacterized protein n=1 Tax=Ancylostoma ceylanicum TaxID=53326 RepID=A0A016UT87_9BILA|nr:hypothetical protein Y032_0030g2223 [Ancylostoma ceylanicum]